MDGRTDGRRDGRTDGQTDGRSETNIPPTPIPPPLSTTSLCGGIIMGYRYHFYSSGEIPWHDIRRSLCVRELGHSWVCLAPSHDMFCCWLLSNGPSKLQENCLRLVCWLSPMCSEGHILSGWRLFDLPLLLIKILGPEQSGHYPAHSIFIRKINLIFLVKIHWGFYLRVQLKRCQHWLK